MAVYINGKKVLLSLLKGEDGTSTYIYPVLRNELVQEGSSFTVLAYGFYASGQEPKIGDWIFFNVQAEGKCYLTTTIITDVAIVNEGGDDPSRATLTVEVRVNMEVGYNTQNVANVDDNGNLVIGETTLSETQLQALLALI